ncbi:F-box/LRR-repeat protein fbxl-1 isoform X2 [Scaptodrosophila lebanonensis]|uniref:F-box/LRR-repeat protein fbxl-1 isoform X2 n=1 Tax=Drosophila lebanonensis TaxID=7225 RepID=A0A6J2T1E8_DROLE|nr:F-box/LRR-repeat protein fbxl-1 isoform X2 [Scaptodrosophila lebanonensis]XP_030369829.1 F-box/LRR-repeat protein fbxl-1 isoform X2 [Scaptodrosophila lebanonensis]XP_030369830.1 F-box/LRR-repeat protein fbxl-1 isoform X2 [Scaptodrosophila lebanonensis]XP_030369831.1 F-box/LRR-repeat protein fbxl-1 isoform X2 [Scaptodrosophila lebanonensis]XP_030369832.1 F-box/LRR-repeat protein fbxl-1 isoform X2 [Scaptodrosophila lebanonensis]
MDNWNVLAAQTSSQAIGRDEHNLAVKTRLTIEKLPDKVLLHIFSYLSHREICRLARICRRWRQIAYDTRLWKNVSLRPEISGLHVGSLEMLLQLISVRFGPTLRYIELPIELITHTVLHELSAKCPNLTHMLLDFSTAMQLHDFSEMQAFPTKLRYMCICLSEVIFMEGFMRKIYNFINGLEVLHLIGTYEKCEEEEEEIYEVINVHKLKSATPNLRVINLYGINFIDDSHIDAFSSNCIQLECLAVNFCNKVTGSTLKTLIQRSKRLTCLLMNGTSLKSEFVMQAEWDKCALQELDITATDLSTECLVDMLTRIPSLKFLSAGQINGFNDTVLKQWMEAGTTRSLISLDLDSSDNITDEALLKFLQRHGHQLSACCLSGMPHITDQLWMSVLPLLGNCKIVVMGTAEKLGVNIHVDQLMDTIASSCGNLERLELRWDPDNLRFSDKSQKAIDILRVKCLKLRCMVLSDGRYYETVKANFERADRITVVRTTTCCRVSPYHLLRNYNDLIFN